MEDPAPDRPLVDHRREGNNPSGNEPMNTTNYDPHQQQAMEEKAKPDHHHHPRQPSSDIDDVKGTNNSPPSNDDGEKKVVLEDELPSSSSVLPATNNVVHSTRQVSAGDEDTIISAPPPKSAEPVVATIATSEAPTNNNNSSAENNQGTNSNSGHHEIRNHNDVMGSIADPDPSPANNNNSIVPAQESRKDDERPEKEVRPLERNSNVDAPAVKRQKLQDGSAVPMEPKEEEEPSSVPADAAALEETEPVTDNDKKMEVDSPTEKTPEEPVKNATATESQERKSSDPKTATVDMAVLDVETNSSVEKKAPKHIRSKHMDPKVLEVRRRIQVGCRDNNLEVAMEAYEDAIREDIRMEAQSFYNLLNLCDGLERTVHVGTPKGGDSSSGCNNAASTKPSLSPSPATAVEDDSNSGIIDNKKRQAYAFRLKDHMVKLNFPLNENAYTAIVKVLVRNKEYAKAEEMIDESESVQQCKPRLRLFTALLTAYCDERQMVQALKCWLRIAKNQLELTEREFLSLMKCAIATGDVHVFDRVVRDIAETVAVPSKDTVSGILEWYVSPHATVHTDPIRIPKHADESHVQSLLAEIHKDEVEAPPSMGPVQTENGWNVSSAVPIDTQTGTLKNGCLKDCMLKPAQLSSRAWDEMMKMNESIVLEGQVEGNTSQYQGGRKGKMRSDFDPQERKDNWKKFTNFLESMGHIDVVIDSANVGYFKQNFAKAPKHVDYEQIDWVARRLQAMGKKVLLVLHQRHFSRKLMPENFRPLQRAWEKMGILYKTPPGMNDDWFWLHAALRYKTLVLTNDEMRDHHFQMLAPRTFLRWKERHQVHFSFGDWEGGKANATATDTAKGGRQVELQFPSVYSRRVQRVEDGLVVPLIKRGDENRFLDGKHTAESDEPEEETYLCIRAFQGPQVLQKQQQQQQQQQQQ